jgi:hypothetical protein
MRTERALAGATVVIAGFLLVAQAFRVDRSNPPVENEMPAPPAIRSLLRRACYDCHSNETLWPWYVHLAPASWLLAHDVREGRETANFSAWGYAPARRAKVLRESAEELVEREMPPWYYRLLHPEARLDAAEIETLRAWLTEEARR